MKPSLPYGADARPRIYLRATAKGAAYRLDRSAINHDAPTLGEAFEAAVHAAGGRDAVIIFEANGHG